MWTDYFDAIYLINLPGREERLKQATAELSRYNIPFEIYPAIKDDNGAKGIFYSVKNILYDAAFLFQYKRILMYEDDIIFDQPPAPTMDLCIAQLEKIDWDIFYQGPNTHQNFPAFTSPNILPVFNSFGLHATAYSISGMKKVFDLPWNGTALDVLIKDRIQPQNTCYCSYPFLATQRSGFSDIQKKHMDQRYIKERFYKHVAHLL